MNQQSSMNLTSKSKLLEDQLNNGKSKELPKKIGIVFLGRKRRHQNKRLEILLRKIGVRSKLYLDFDEIACAHILLQMNNIQNLFEFQVIEVSNIIEDVSITTRNNDHMVLWFDVSTNSTQSFITNDEDYMLQWFEHVVSSKLENDSGYPASPMDYWIGITSEGIGSNFFCWTEKEKDKIVTIITSENWQREYSPPSVFEYIAISTFRCSLRSLIRDFIGRLKDHNEMRGCIFDYTEDKRYRRISISNPNLCSGCKETIQELEVIIQKSLDEQISKVLSRKWLGSIKKENSPMYNLRRNYGYNAEVNSGFYKGWFESVRDNIKENWLAWLITGILGIGFLLLGNLLQILFRLQL
jgi:hypothetical protein